MRDSVKFVLCRDHGPQPLHIRAIEFDDAMTSMADHVIVRVLPEGVFVMGELVAELDLPDDAATD
jgi:hypothetical protein